MLTAFGVPILQVAGYAITIIVGFLSIFWLISWAGTQHAPKVPGFEGFDAEDAEERVRKCTSVSTINT